MIVFQGSRTTPVVALLIAAATLGWSAASTRADDRVGRSDRPSLTTLPTAAASDENQKPTLKEWVIRQVGVTAAVLFFPPGYPLSGGPTPPNNDASQNTPTDFAPDSFSTNPPPSAPPPPSPTSTNPPPSAPPPPNPVPNPVWNPPAGDQGRNPPPPHHDPPADTPEPATLVSGLVGLGLLGVYALRARRRLT
jgi:hypothetical protein